MKRPLFWIGIAFLSSTAAFLRLDIPLAAAASLLIWLSVLFLSSDKPTIGRAALFLFCCALGGGWALGYSTERAAYLAPVTQASQQAAITMTVTDHDVSSGYRKISGRALISANGVSSSADIELWGYFDDDISRGDTLCCVAKSTSPLKFSLEKLLPAPENPPFPLTAARLRLQKAVSDRIYCLLGGSDEGGVLCALISGDKSRIAADVTADFRKSSLSHLLVISGMHMVLINSACLAVLSRIMPQRAALLASAAICWCFAAVSGFGVSVMRACIMMTIMNAAQCFGRKSDTLTSLMAAALIVTISDPEALFSASFLLSFSAVAGIAVLGGGLSCSQPQNGRRNGLAAIMQQNAKTAAAAQLGTLPVCALLFKSVPLLGIFANLAAVWLLQPVMISGLLGLILGFILPLAASVLLLPAKLLIRLMIFIAHCFAAIPFSAEGFCESWQLLWLLLSFILAAVVICRAPKGCVKRLAACLCAAVYLTMSVFSLCLSVRTADILIFEQSGCAAIIKNGRALLFGAPQNSYELYEIENAFSQLGVVSLDAVIPENSEQIGYTALSLMQSSGCTAVCAEADRYLAVFCRGAGIGLYRPPQNEQLFGSIGCRLTNSGYELSFEGCKLLKSEGKYDIIGKYTPAQAVNGALRARITV